MSEINDFENDALGRGILCPESRMLAEVCRCEHCDTVTAIIKTLRTGSTTNREFSHRAANIIEDQRKFIDRLLDEAETRESELRKYKPVYQPDSWSQE